MAILAKNYKDKKPIINGISNEYPIGSGTMKTEVMATYNTQSVNVQKGDLLHLMIEGDKYIAINPINTYSYKPNAIALQSGVFGSTIRTVPLEII